ncbi:hypothetical protein BCT50_08185 [Vibrio lentus]|uniref:Uncharacterized protein n=1 Tax=Vibrio lentus TaxID=136468 RepID=A0A855IS67_9VIBR|nr:hypothetical protein BCT50_08185 [Vibrio lentus]
MGVIFFAEVEILWESLAFWVCWVMAELWIRLVWGGLDWDLVRVLGSNKRVSETFYSVNAGANRG